jgi:DNA-binding CsgD family transcriptional regulator
MSKDLIDRILNGEFEDSDNTLEADASVCQDAEMEDPTEEEELLEDEEEEFEEIPSEEVDDEYNNYDNQTPDEPSEEWLEKNCAPVAQYVEMPKQSRTKEPENKTMETPNETPKQSVTASPDTTKSSSEPKRRGAPHKLKDNVEEVCRLYAEGCSALQIGKQFGVSVSCVINTLKRNGVDVRSKGRQKSKD